MTEAASLPLRGVLVLDVDGTMVATPSDRISRSLASALIDAEKNGWGVVIATSRSPQSLAKLGLPEQLDVLVTVANGAAVLDVRTSRLTRHRLISPADVRWIVAMLSDERLYKDFGGTIARTEHPATADATWKASGAEEIPDGHWAMKFIVRGRNRTGNEVTNRLAGVLGPRFAVTYTRDELVEITAASATKLSAVMYLLRPFEVDHERTVAFGDAMNDVDVLRWAAHSYAVAPLTPGLADVVDAVLPEIGGDCLAKAILSVVSRLTVGE